MLRRLIASTPASRFTCMRTYTPTPLGAFIKQAYEDPKKAATLKEAPVAQRYHLLRRWFLALTTDEKDALRKLASRYSKLRQQVVAARRAAAEKSSSPSAKVVAKPSPVKVPAPAKAGPKAASSPKMKAAAKKPKPPAAKKTVTTKAVKKSSKPVLRRLKRAVRSMMKAKVVKPSKFSLRRKSKAKSKAAAQPKKLSKAKTTTKVTTPVEPKVLQAKTASMESKQAAVPDQKGKVATEKKVEKKVAVAAAIKQTPKAAAPETTKASTKAEAVAPKPKAAVPVPASTATARVLAPASSPAIASYTEFVQKHFNDAALQMLPLEERMSVIAKLFVQQQ